MINKWIEKIYELYRHFYIKHIQPKSDKQDLKKAIIKMSKKDKIKFEQVVKTVSRINTKLKSKGFDLKEIDCFWKRILALIPKIEETGIENIKVCTGCGHLNIEDLRPTALACCPDNHYINIGE